MNIGLAIIGSRRCPFASLTTELLRNSQNLYTNLPPNFGALRGFAKGVPRRGGRAQRSATAGGDFPLIMQEKQGGIRSAASSGLPPPFGLFVCGFQFFEVLVGFGLPLFALGFFFLLLKEFVEGLVKDGRRNWL